MSTTPLFFLFLLLPLSPPPPPRYEGIRTAGRSKLRWLNLVPRRRVLRYTKDEYKVRIYFCVIIHVSSPDTRDHRRPLLSGATHVLFQLRPMLEKGGWSRGSNHWFLPSTVSRVSRAITNRFPFAPFLPSLPRSSGQLSLLSDSPEGREREKKKKKKKKKKERKGKEREREKRKRRTHRFVVKVRGSRRTWWGYENGGECRPLLIRHPPRPPGAHPTSPWKTGHHVVEPDSIYVCRLSSNSRYTPTAISSLPPALSSSSSSSSAAAIAAVGSPSLPFYYREPRSRLSCSMLSIFIYSCFLFLGLNCD